MKTFKENEKQSIDVNIQGALLNHQISPILSNFVMAWEVQDYIDSLLTFSETHVKIKEIDELKVFAS